ncbi:N-acetylneuraminate synthase family protein [Desulfohalobium retbaense]|nr:N-acetylneuraminate synthase family protein [Desulfohalobium retbaense]
MSVQFIAEVSSNHHQNLDRCFQFIDEAARIGCSGVKFQLFKVDELFAPEVFKAKPDVAKRRQWELPVAFLPELATRCHDNKISFSCTPFYLQAVQELSPYVDFYKIASYELLWDDLLKACAQTGKPLVLSTGMATMQEIEHAVNVILDSTPQTAEPGQRTPDHGLRTTDLPPLTLLHCVSGYPAPPNQCNLAAIETIRNAYAQLSEPCPRTPDHGPRTPDIGAPASIQVGWSDHSVSPGVIHRAVHRWGAKMIEFHLDLEGEGEEYSAGHCWLPDEIKPVIDTVQKGFQADGNGRKEPMASEADDRNWRADPEDGLRPLKKFRNDIEIDL